MGQFPSYHAELRVVFVVACDLRPIFPALHRYWTKDMTNINPHFGSTDDLHALSKALHKRGMYLMFDVVLNHMAAPTLKDFNFSDFFHPFTDESYFHKQCWVNDSSDQTTIEQCWLGDENLPLPDLNTDNSTVADTLKKMVTDLVAEYEVDGLRLDTVKHISKDFWRDFRDDVDVFMMGEILTNETSYATSYTGKIILDCWSFCYVNCRPVCLCRCHGRNPRLSVMVSVDPGFRLHERQNVFVG